ncbi:unnamed protein product [Prunus armeniaca]
MQIPSLLTITPTKGGWVKRSGCLAAKTKSETHGHEEPNDSLRCTKKEGIGNFGRNFCTETISSSNGKQVSLYRGMTESDLARTHFQQLKTGGYCPISEEGKEGRNNK